MSLTEDRIREGKCARCGNEAAPYRECYECRQKARLMRTLKRLRKFDIVKSIGDGRHAMWSLGPKADDKNAHKEVDKWQTPWHLPESDKRSHPKLRGIRVDVERTLVQVIHLIGRPCTTEEIISAWGKLRAKRTEPLPVDLACIIAAQDRRERKAAKHRALIERQQRKAD